MAEKTRSRRKVAKVADPKAVPPAVPSPRRPGEGRFFLGTSGFSYDAWKGGFYPKTLPTKDMLSFYAGRYSSVEIHHTFRRWPTEKALATWRGAVPDGFVFTIKAHMAVTLPREPAAAKGKVHSFLDALLPLGDRTGPILFGCPERLKLDRARLEEFLAILPARHRYAFELRDPSWAEARPLIEARGMAWCVSETDESDASGETLATGAFHFLRLRKSRYTAAEISGWARRIGAALRAGRDVCCYFKHEDEGRGPRFAAALGEAVAGERGRPRDA